MSCRIAIAAGARCHGSNCLTARNRGAAISRASINRPRTLLQAGTSQREIERVTGIDRKTIRTYHKRFASEGANSPGVATGPKEQIPPPRPPAAATSNASACQGHREFIEHLPNEVANRTRKVLRNFWREPIDASLAIVNGYWNRWGADENLD